MLSGMFDLMDNAPSAFKGVSNMIEDAATPKQGKMGKQKGKTQAQKIRAIKAVFAELPTLSLYILKHLFKVCSIHPQKHSTGCFQKHSSTCVSDGAESCWAAVAVSIKPQARSEQRNSRGNQPSPIPIRPVLSAMLKSPEERSHTL